MKKFVLFLSLLAVTVFVIYVPYNKFESEGEEGEYFDEHYEHQKEAGKITSAKQKPADWFYMQRAYPHERIPDSAYVNAYNAVKEFNKKADKSAFSSNPWVPAGPTNIPGRIPCLAVDPTDPATIYAGSAAGGVFKTTDFGSTWTPIFDSIANLSIGAITIHPTNPNIIYVGTGEANAANDTYEGIGVFKSTDAGATWTNIGLPSSYKIGRIVLDPARPDTVLVAVEGKLFGINPERGVYRSQDGGANWEQLYSIDDTTGCIDIVIDSTSGTMLAAMWTRYRDREYRTVGGVNSGIYRSTDGGANWERLSIGLPAPADTIGRIGLAIEQSTSTVYAIYVNHPGNFVGIYKSTSLGTFWSTVATQADLGDIYSGFGWYFGQIRVAPGDPDRIYALGVELYKSDNGGSVGWDFLGYGTHADHHDLIIDPNNHNNIYEGSDGGVSYSSDAGFNWNGFQAMPTTQFYAMTIDPSNSDILYGGTQDNGSNRSTSSAVDTWDHFGGGDGFYCEVDPTDPDVYYAEYQWGQVYKIDHGSWNWVVDWNFYNADRHNWCTPFKLDPQNHMKLYYGSNNLYLSTDGGFTWSQKSNDLTNGPGTGNLTYGTLTTIDVAPTDSTVVYVGTDDGNVWVTQNADNAGMFTWTNVSGSLPDRWITHVKVDPYNAAIAYVTLSGYKDGEHLPHIYRTDNYGASWTDISGDLPDFPINDVIVDPDLDSTLYIGTDFGAFYTTDLGVTWNQLGTGLPVVAIHDMDFHPGDRILAAGTHGRSMYKLDLGTGTPSCCIGSRGNVNGDPADQIDISDLVYLVDYSFNGGPAPPCFEEADVDASGEINIADIVYLVNYMFLGDFPPPACP